MRCFMFLTILFNRYFIYFIIIILSISCTKNFDKLNIPQDKIIAEDVNIGLLGQALAQAQFYGLCGDNQAFQRSQSLFSDVYAQYFAITEPNFDSGKFIEVQGWTNRYYNDVYQKAAPQLLFVKEFANNNSLDAGKAVAMVWEVEMYHRISDFFGPVIYSNFGNGQTSVKYDSQRDAYLRFFNILDTATMILKDHLGENVFGSNDLVYNGNIDQWFKFANSLRLRLAVRLSYVEPDLAKEQAEKAIKDGVIESNEDNAMVQTTLNNLNHYASITYIDEFRMSATMESILKGYEDPRMERFFSPAADGSGFAGVRNGLPRLEMGKFLNPSHAFINDDWRPMDRNGINPPLDVMKVSEVYFLRAEGALRGWEMGDEAIKLYEKGIELSLSQWGVSNEVVNKYINSSNTAISLNDKWNSPAAANVPVKFDENGDFEKNLEQIITQKWIALFPDSWEAWSERRRTGYPVGMPLLESLNPDIPVDGMMRRLMFTTGEISTNLSAVEEAREMLNGPDANHTRLWWDAK